MEWRATERAMATDGDNTGNGYSKDDDGGDGPWFVCVFWCVWRDQILAARGLEELFSSCAVVSVFWLWREIVLGLTYLPHQLCRCVFFFCGGI
jgi:hypothetical protein